ncbi:hypothetical protein BDP27DRAFT_1219161, partial [Rhodocollybia butyracea]
LGDSNILVKFANFAFRPDVPGDAPIYERNFIVFGDPAYGYGPHLASPFADDDMSEDEKAWNNAMSAVRIEVEHGFGVVVSLWPFLNISRKMQIFSSPVGRYYRVGVLLMNLLIHYNCFRPNQISQRFECPPPTVDEYLILFRILVLSLAELEFLSVRARSRRQQVGPSRVERRRKA